VVGKVNVSFGSPIPNHTTVDVDKTIMSVVVGFPWLTLSHPACKLTNMNGRRV